MFQLLRRLCRKARKVTLEHFSITFFIEIEKSNGIFALFMIPKVKMSPFPNSNRTQLLFTGVPFGVEGGNLCGLFAVSRWSGRRPVLYEITVCSIWSALDCPLWTDYEKWPLRMEPSI